MRKHINSSNIHIHKKPHTGYVGLDIEIVKSQGFVVLTFPFKRKHDIKL